MILISACIPRILPRAAVRKTLILEKLQKEGKSIQAFFEKTEAAKPSLQDLMKTFRRLSRNKVFVYNNLAAVFYLFGFMPFYTYKAKFIEVQYLVSPSVANAVTGIVYDHPNLYMYFNDLINLRTCFVNIF